MQVSTPLVGSSTPLSSVNNAARNNAGSINRTPKSSIPHPGRIMSNDRSSSTNLGYDKAQQQAYYKNLASSRSLFGKGKVKPTFGMTV